MLQSTQQPALEELVDVWHCVVSLTWDGPPFPVTLTLCSCSVRPPALYLLEICISSHWCDSCVLLTVNSSVLSSSSASVHQFVETQQIHSQSCDLFYCQRIIRTTWQCLPSRECQKLILVTVMCIYRLNMCQKLTSCFCSSMFVCVC